MSFENFEQRGFREMFNRRAPEGMYRVVGMDSLNNRTWLGGDFDTQEEAKQSANYQCGDLNNMHIYDDQGELIEEIGKIIKLD
jgi:hypothetical protein